MRFLLNRTVAPLCAAVARPLMGSVKRLLFGSRNDACGPEAAAGPPRAETRPRRIRSVA